VIIIIEPNRRIQITSVENVHTINRCRILCYYIIVIITIIITMLYTKFRRGFSYVQTFSAGLRNAHYDHGELLCFSITRLCLFFCDNIKLGTSEKFLFSFKHTHTHIVLLLLFTDGSITFSLSCPCTHNR